MGMAAYGQPGFLKDMDKKLFKNTDSLLTRRNLQKGLEKIGLPDRILLLQDEWGHKKIDYDSFWVPQALIERKLTFMPNKAKRLTGSKNLVFMGGVALNCVANSNLYNIFDDVHIMPKSWGLR